jgi:hypothetical protein
MDGVRQAARGVSRIFFSSLEDGIRLSREKGESEKI